ncbi:hypothetical protein [Urechidicola vernalis]|uniref:DUF4440 domain-containing protein n=1 Tax=Urechidicola vernalis TaxID=3075600 RepID=A0ABU2Y744_9FLAO|nr:hypothetical protein [Urechidicola sp. P050]MDT0553045.1 hypothetical protein [Urechidicola sp. P050]
MNTRLFVFLFSVVIFSMQAQHQSESNLKELNLVWSKFYMAFDSLDYSKMAEIHSKKLIRISGEQKITDYENYISNYKKRFKKAREEQVTNKIALRFFERIQNDSVASERGIYKLVRTDKNQNSKAYYGQFHVLFIKEHKEWKILMDYDSNEKNTIGEASFQNAKSIEDFKSFIK